MYALCHNVGTKFICHRRSFNSHKEFLRNVESFLIIMRLTIHAASQDWNNSMHTWLCCNYVNHSVLHQEITLKLFIFWKHITIRYINNLLIAPLYVTRFAKTWHNDTFLEVQIFASVSSINL